MRQDQPFQTDTTLSCQVHLSLKLKLGINNSDFEFSCTVQFCSVLRHNPISFSALFVLLFSLLNNKILHVDVILKTKCFKNLKIVQLQSKISDRVSKSLNSTRLARGQCLCFCSDDVSRGINLLAAGGEKTPFCR